MKNQEHIPWVEKYRPKKMNDVIQDDIIKKLLHTYVESGDISHMLLYGPPGTGKTSTILAIGREIFKEHFSTRVIEFNASNDRGINAVREKITNEAKKYVSSAPCSDGTMIPPYKIIILDEADSMTDEAQDALRVVIEKYSTVTRFCFICNYICKITDPIKSRCYPIYFKKLSITCMIEKLKIISDSEEIMLSDKILNTIINISNGDMRKAIIILQNTKYVYDFKKINSKTFNEMTTKELKLLPIMSQSNLDDKSFDITKKDIYNIFACMDPVIVESIVDEIFSSINIVELMGLSKRIIGFGYPVDNVMLQINTTILNTDQLSDLEKATIFHHASQVFYKMKMCASEYIQLLDYIVCVNKVKRGGYY